MERPLHNSEVAVVYLSWIPYGIDLLKRFLSSYENFPSGHPHRFYLLLNGTAIENNHKAFIEEIRNRQPGAEIIELASGQDIDAYFHAANHLQEEYILFLNSFSLFTSTDWLKKYWDVMVPEVGLVGATASCQSFYSTVFINNQWKWNSRSSFSQNFRKFKLLVKASVFWRFLYPPFPNPHIRTTAFMIRKSHFLALRKKELKRKFDAYQFESGTRSMTKQIEGMGLKAVVIGKDGKAYFKDQFVDSRTFWIGEQENVLVKDNQTELYANADESYQAYLRKIAWNS